MDKYYTPKVEELHPFIELYVEGKKEILGTSDVIDLYSRNLGKLQVGKNVKIKYLDKEDIESFGFKLKENDDLINEHYILGEAPNSIRLTKVDSKTYPHWTIESINIRGDKTYINFIFQGSIKNKSELKKLLQQLNTIR